MKLITKILTLFVLASLLIPAAFAINERDEFYNSYERSSNNGRYQYVEKSYNNDNYVSDYDNQYVRYGYGSTKYVDQGRTEYVRSDYGRDYYTRDSYSSLPYGRSSYVSSGYGTTNTNKASIRSTHYVDNGYGSTNVNKAGIRNNYYVKTGYGSGSASSGLTGNYVKVGSVGYGDPEDLDSNYRGTNYVAKTPQNDGTYRYYRVPVGNDYENRGYKTNYEYRVKVYKVNKNSYAYDSYPFN